MELTRRSRGITLEHNNNRSEGDHMNTKHIISIEFAKTSDQPIAWACACGAGRTAGDLTQAGAEGRNHLRSAEEGLI